MKYQKQNTRDKLKEVKVGIKIISNKKLSEDFKEPSFRFRFCLGKFENEIKGTSKNKNV